MTRGKFIVLEGAGGSGKSSCIEFLQEQLPADKVLFTREPGGTEAGEEIRAVLLKEDRAVPLNALEQLLGMEMSRSIHVRSVVRPALESGMHVICDRFSASTYGYQVIAGSTIEDMRQLFHEVEKMATGRLEPDLWVFLSVPVEVGMKRRAAVGGSTSDVFDKKQASFQQKVLEGTKFFLHYRPHVEIDARAPLVDVQTRVLAEVTKFLCL